MQSSMYLGKELRAGGGSMVTVVDGSVPEKMKDTFPHKLQTMLGKSKCDISTGIFLTCRTQ